MLCPFFRPKMFSPGDRVPLTHTWCTCVGHCCGAFTKWATTVQSVLFSYPEILYRSFGPPITCVLHESRWQSITAKVASLVFCLLASVEGTTVCLELPLQSPALPQGGDHHLATVCPPCPPRGRPSRPVGRDFKGGGRVIHPPWIFSSNLEVVTLWHGFSKGGLCSISINLFKRVLYLKPPMGAHLALSALCAQCNYLGVWPY